MALALSNRDSWDFVFVDMIILLILVHKYMHYYQLNIQYVKALVSAGRVRLRVFYATPVLPQVVFGFLVEAVSLLFCGGPSRTRTCDPLIMSEVV